VTLLKSLRKHAKWVAGSVLPVLAFVWLGAAASPCIGMIVDRGAVAGNDAHGDRASSHHHHLGYPCPHCPGGGDHTAPHIACATLASFADGGKPLALPAWDFTHALAAVDVVPLDEQERSAEGGAATEPIAVPASVPLNLRYCVFLN
jgi:hypothetical protein